MDNENNLDPSEFWEQRYAAADRVWSGKVNQVLHDVGLTLTPGSALDLGCGEGGDVIWLAQQGWHALGLDISATAVRRATEAAQARGFTEQQARFQNVDVTQLDVDQRFDLISASFLHMSDEQERVDILRRAAAHVAHGGHLLLTSHAEPPPWARGMDHGELNDNPDQQTPSSRHPHQHDQGNEHQHGHSFHTFPTPEKEVASLALDEEQWNVVLAETRERTATGPGGENAQLTDTVVLLQRR